MNKLDHKPSKCLFCRHDVVPRRDNFNQAINYYRCRTCNGKAHNECLSCSKFCAIYNNKHHNKRHDLELTNIDR